MRFVRTRVLVLLFVFISGLLQAPAQAEILQLTVAEDKTTGYNRSAFKHWVDADKNGCNTRAEVLIAEAIVKPKIGPKCKLTGGRWFSTYDGKTITNASQLDVDHLVPLAEAWRSGAWKWTAAQRQAFANDLDDYRSLIAVTLTSNRSKGDKDPALWMPSSDKCVYLVYWATVKWRYSLTTDLAESAAIARISQDCFGETTLRLPPNVYKVIDGSETKTLTPTPAPPTPTSNPIVTPGAFCSPVGATGKSSSGVTYTCKSSPTDSRNRWRQ